MQDHFYLTLVMVAFNSSALVVSALISAISFYGLRKQQHVTPRVSQQFQRTYDYIVVGSGSAGSTVATRLAEDPKVTVLVIEAGGMPDLRTEVPLMASQLIRSELDWAYNTIPQNNSCLGQVEQRCFVPRGKMLGGSSNMNFMMYSRGNRLDYDQWEALGCEGWSWKNVLPYFIKAEDNVDDPSTIDPGFHGRRGPLTISTPKFSTLLGDAFLEAGTLLGYGVTDINGRNQTGFTRVQATIRNSLRCSTATAYLGPASQRDNLDVLVHAHVTKIILDGRNRAEAVQFEYKGQRFVVNARHEIIVSAGAIGSPQLLLLSGIGPRRELEQYKIPVKVDLPGVGKNLQDHIGVWSSHFLINSTNISLNVDLLSETPEKLETFMKDGTGEYASLGGIENTAFIYTSDSEWVTGWPDVQLVFISLALDKQITSFMNPTESLLRTFQSYASDENAFSILPVLLRPRSRGTVTLASSNPYDAPLIDPKHLTDEDDLHRLVKALKIIKKLVDTEPFQKLGTSIPKAKYDDCLDYEDDTDELLACIVKVVSQTIYHPAGTCKMGSLKDPMAVLDSNLRVRGVNRLRVVDASVMPTIVSGNTNAPTIMIAEKAADLIKLSRYFEHRCKYYGDYRACAYI